MSIKIDDDAIIYPESDGQPMADNTEQFKWIVTIKGGLEVVFKDDPNVFVAGDLLWYPVQGDNTNRVAPDAMVAFGRPKGKRGSYQQWNEDNIAPQVVFEVLSPGNRPSEMQEKFDKYQRYGVQEYYIYDPDRIKLEGWQRTRRGLTPIKTMQNWVSPLLGVRFALDPTDYLNELKIYGPDGRLFVDYVEVAEQRRQAELRALQAESRADQEQQRAIDAERAALAEQQLRIEAEQRALVEQQRRVEAEQRALQAEQQRQQQSDELARLKALLRQQGLDAGGQ